MVKDCWTHDWSKWDKIGEGRLFQESDTDKATGMPVIIQQRECGKCGRIDTRRSDE